MRDKDFSTSGGLARPSLASSPATTADRTLNNGSRTVLVPITGIMTGSTVRIVAGPSDTGATGIAATTSAISIVKTPGKAMNSVVIKTGIFGSFRHRLQILVKSQLLEI